MGGVYFEVHSINSTISLFSTLYICNRRYHPHMGEIFFKKESIKIFEDFIK